MPVPVPVPVPVVEGCAGCVVVVDGAGAGCSVVVVVDGAGAGCFVVVVVVDGVVLSVPVVAGGVPPPNQPAHHPISARTMMMPTTQAMIVFRFMLISAMSHSIVDVELWVTKGP